MEAHDLERIAKAVLRELGAGEAALTLEADQQPDRWRLSIGGPAPSTLLVRAGRGTSAQHIRQQIFEHFQNR